MSSSSAAKASFPERDATFLAACLAPRRKVPQMPKVARRLRRMRGKSISAPAPPYLQMLAPKIGVERAGSSWFVAKMWGDDPIDAIWGGEVGEAARRGARHFKNGV
jgi:hypothetical protein